jgi:hypothetical protein
MDARQWPVLSQGRVIGLNFFLVFYGRLDNKWGLKFIDRFGIVGGKQTTEELTVWLMKRSSSAERNDPFSSTR